MENKITQNNSLEAIRHSLAHLLGAAVLKLWPETKLAIGPAIENGFYYDFEFVKTITNEDLGKIEKEMRRLGQTWDQFKKIEETPESALTRYQNNPYKKNLIEEIAERGEKITSYQSGEFIDLCRGGHVNNAREIDLRAFKLTHLAGAYWRGDEKNPMLTRIYGLAFENELALDTYVKQQEEAQKRDHRKLGKELGLFEFSEAIGPGLPLFFPKGAILRRLIENYLIDLQEKNGYEPIWIPHITKGELYKISGHLDKYDSMYPPMKLENEADYYLKPMNCPHFMMLYKAEPHSYKELPIRWTCTTTNYRYEKSGELTGLSRVRALTQDDCHVFTRPDQIKQEIEIMLDMIEQVYSDFGFKDFSVRISVHDPKDQEKYIGDEKIWENSESILKELVEARSWKHEIGIGEAAFYGPKLDFILKDTLGRDWQLSTIQLDLNLPERFDLEYVNENNKKERPVVIHRAILGSTERFLSIFIEDCAGAFPLWLAPIQIKILTISEKQNSYSQEILAALKKAGFRVELNNQNETIGKKIRAAEMQKIPYLLILGDKEMEAQTVAIRKRGQGDQGTMKIEEFIKMIKTEVSEKV
ncbi:threonine--tRNA ligase [Candidatus Azambacteria bacterium]|nr:threonine--tRNA ligase [Candidatus Azambacteria bacterium]